MMHIRTFYKNLHKLLSHVINFSQEFDVLCKKGNGRLEIKSDENNNNSFLETLKQFAAITGDIG